MQNVKSESETEVLIATSSASVAMATNVKEVKTGIISLLFQVWKLAYS